MQLIAATYPDRASAEAARSAVAAADGDALDVYDLAIADRGSDGKIHLHHQHQRNLAGGAIGGTLVGLFVAALFPPAFLAEVLLGLAGGAAGGYFSGHKDRGTFRDFVDSLEPGTAALVLLADPVFDAEATTALFADAIHVTSESLEPEDAQKLRESF